MNTSVMNHYTEVTVKNQKEFDSIADTDQFLFVKIEEADITIQSCSKTLQISAQDSVLYLFGKTNVKARLCDVYLFDSSTCNADRCKLVIKEKASAYCHSACYVEIKDRASVTLLSGNSNVKAMGDVTIHSFDSSIITTDDSFCNCPIIHLYGPDADRTVVAKNNSKVIRWKGSTSFMAYNESLKIKKSNEMLDAILRGLNIRK